MDRLENRKQMIRQAVEAGDLGQLIFLLENEEKTWSTTAPRRRDEALMHALVVENEPISGYLLMYGAKVDMDLVDWLSGDSLELLLALGWDINTIMPSGHTMLWDFIADEEFVHYLLGRGADPNVGNRADSHPGILLAIAHPTDVIERAAYLATPSIMDLLIAYGARLEKSVPIHTIAALGSLDDGPARLHAMVEHLQALGMDISDAHQFFSGCDPITPLDGAINANYPEMARFLLEHGANPMIGRLSSDLARQLFGPSVALVELLEVFERSCQQDLEAMQELFGTGLPPEQPLTIAGSEYDESCS